MRNVKFFCNALLIVVLVAASFIVSGFKSKNTISPASDCFVVMDRGANNNCTNNYWVKVRNQCTEKMQLMYALKRTDDKEVMMGQRTLEPGEQITVSTCFGNGAYKLFQRRPGSSEVFPTKEEVLARW